MRKNRHTETNSGLNITLATAVGVGKYSLEINIITQNSRGCAVVKKTHVILFWKRPMLSPWISGAYFRESAMPRNFFGAVFSCICYAPEFWGRSFVNRLCPRICDSVIYFIHQMAIHNATKLLPLTNQTKLTLTVTLTLNDTVTVIFLRAFR